MKLILQIVLVVIFSLAKNSVMVDHVKMSNQRYLVDLAYLETGDTSSELENVFSNTESGSLQDHDNDLDDLDDSLISFYGESHLNDLSDSFLHSDLVSAPLFVLLEQIPQPPRG